MWKGRLEKKTARDSDVKYILRRPVVLEVLGTNPRRNQLNIRRTMDVISYLHRVWKLIYMDQDFTSLSIIYFSQFRDRIFLRYPTETATVLLLPNFNSLFPAWHYQFITRVSDGIVNCVYHFNSATNIFHSSNQMYANCYVNIQEFDYF